MKKIIFLFFSCLFLQDVWAQKLRKEQFQNPPQSARPRVWWHWMNGNITKEGIKADLDWMKSIGLGGVQHFDANLGTPQIVAQKITYMSPEWKDAFAYATHLAQKHQLEMAIAGSPGWSVTGGPWVKPEDGMKKYVWTEILVKGGLEQRIQLPQIEGVTGDFQNAPLLEEDGSISHEKQPSIYQDALVIAFPKSLEEKSLLALHPKVSASAGEFTLASLTDGNLSESTYLPPKAVGEETWVQYEFDVPQTFRAISLAGANHVFFEQFFGGPQNRHLKVSDDGVHFREILAINNTINSQVTQSFPATIAKFWRMSYTTIPASVNPFIPMPKGTPLPAPKGVYLSEFVLHSNDRLDLFEDKAGFRPWKEQDFAKNMNVIDAISPAQIINLTPELQADGSIILSKKGTYLPEGEWVIIRLGYSLTGRKNHPASPEATGFEVDKLDKTAVSLYLKTYLDMYQNATNGGQPRVKGHDY